MNVYKVIFKMKRIGFLKFFLIFALLVNNDLFAAEPATMPDGEIKKTEIASPLSSIEMDLVFFGMVTNESGELYNYYFQMQRKDKLFHAVATLIDSKTKEVLLFEDVSKTIDQPDESSWRVGQAFLQYNPINDSWVFGVKTKEKKGFNFKVDMLQQADNNKVSQDLRSGIELSINQTGRLNGHLQSGVTGKDQFVTASKAWFKQLKVSKSQQSSHPLTGILCQFNDGSGFYSVNLQDAEALRGAVAGWRDAQGAPVSMSQFVSIEAKKENIWQISIPFPKLSLSLEDVLAKKIDSSQLIAGLTSGSTPGFCTITQDEIGMKISDLAAVEQMKKAVT